MFGFLMGLGAGAAFGVLFAPSAGHKTRRMIATKAKESTDAVTTHASGLWESGRSGLIRQRDGVKAAIKAGSKAYQRA
jgi:gas vesicle protein